MNLDEVTEEYRYRITALLDGQTPLDWFTDLGFLPGTEIVRVGQAPFGDPIVVSLRGTRFAIRKQNARQVAVEPR